MTLRVEWLGVAIESVEAERGALALFGVNNVLVYIDQLPDSASLVAVLVAEEEPPYVPHDEELELSLVLSAHGPDGQHLVTRRARMRLGRPPRDDLPRTVQSALPIQIPLTALGPYELRLTIENQASGWEPVTARKRIYVLDQASRREAAPLT